MYIFLGPLIVYHTAPSGCRNQRRGKAIEAGKRRATLAGLAKCSQAQAKEEGGDRSDKSGESMIMLLAPPTLPVVSVTKRNKPGSLKQEEFFLL